MSGKVADRLKPTYEVVTTEFITNTMYKLLYGKDIANFRLIFTEQEANQFIERVLNKYSDYGEFYKIKSELVLESLDENGEYKKDVPTMIVRNHKEFFEQLRRLYEQNIRYFFKRTGLSSFQSYEMVNCFEQVWLRATPEDFDRPERFLKQQVEMMKDTTFNKYDKEVCFGKVPCLDNNILCVQNCVARTWDESSQEIRISIYDKRYYENLELFERPKYTLPVIRYGIFEKDGKKVCRICSIQNKEVVGKVSDVSKRIDRAKYKVNKDIPQDDLDGTEPKNLIALSIFINLLNNERITDIEVPSMYVLDYDFHIKLGKKMMKDLEGSWDESSKERCSSIYKREREHVFRTYKKEDVISEIKTERFIRLFERMLKHYPGGQSISIPMETESLFRIKLPRIRQKSEIKSNMLQEFYTIVSKMRDDIEIL